jgi:hypothetical protein
MSECLTIFRTTRADFEAIKLDYDIAFKVLDGSSNAEKMTEGNVLGSSLAMEEAWSKLISLDNAVQILAGCESLRMSLGFSSEFAASELEDFSEELNKICLRHEHVVKKFEAKLRVGERPLIFGRSEFDTAQKQGFHTINRYRDVSLNGGQYCILVAAAIREKYLSEGPVTLLLHRSSSGEVLEARTINSQPQSVT